MAYFVHFDSHITYRINRVAAHLKSNCYFPIVKLIAANVHFLVSRIWWQIIQIHILFCYSNLRFIQ